MILVFFYNPNQKLKNIILYLHCVNTSSERGCSSICISVTRFRISFGSLRTTFVHALVITQGRRLDKTDSPPSRRIGNCSYLFEDIDYGRRNYTRQK